MMPNMPALDTSTPATATAIADSLTDREWAELTDEVLRRIERRAADELARRGRRSTPRVL